MAKCCKGNQKKILESCTQSDFNSGEETESLKAARAYDGSQIEKYQFHKYYYYGDSEQTTYERALLMADLTLEEFYMMHIKLPARFTVNITVTTNKSNYPFHTDFMFEYYDENSSESLTFSSTTQVSHVATQTNRDFNNSYRSNFAMEIKLARDHGTYTEESQFHKQYYYSGPAFERMSHDLKWNEVRMHILCLERKPIPIFTASYTQKYTWYTRYHADVEYECEIIPLSTDDPLYFMFEYEESIVTDCHSDVTTAHTYFISKDNEIIATNSTLSSGDDKKVAAKNSSKNNCTSSSEESFCDDETVIVQLELTNNHTLSYLEEGTRVYVRTKARHHDDCYSNCCRENETSESVTVATADNTASNSTCTPEENKGIINSKNNCSESGIKTESWCVPTFSATNRSHPNVGQPVFANSSTFSNSTIRARSSSSDSDSWSAYGGGVGAAALPYVSTKVAIAIILIIISVITLFLIVKYFLQPKPKKQEPKPKKQDPKPKKQDPKHKHNIMLMFWILLFGFWVYYVVLVV